MPLKSCETWTSWVQKACRCFHVVESPWNQQIWQPCSSLSFRPRPARRDKLAGCLLLNVVCCVQTTELA